MEEKIVNEKVPPQDPLEHKDRQAPNDEGAMTNVAIRSALQINIQAIKTQVNRSC